MRELPPAALIRPAASPSSSSSRTFRRCSGVKRWCPSRRASDWADWMKPRDRSVYFSKSMMRLFLSSARLQGPVRAPGKRRQRLAGRPRSRTLDGILEAEPLTRQSNMVSLPCDDKIGETIPPQARSKLLRWIKDMISRQRAEGSHGKRSSAVQPDRTGRLQPVRSGPPHRGGGHRQVAASGRASHDARGSCGQLHRAGRGGLHGRHGRHGSELWPGPAAGRSCLLAGTGAGGRGRRRTLHR